MFFPPSDHYMTQFFTQISPGTPYFLPMIIYPAYLVFLWLKHHVCKTDFRDIKEMIILQRLNPFFEVLKTKSQKTWLREETVCRERISM